MSLRVDNNGAVLLRTPSGRERKLPTLRPRWKWVHLGDVTEVVRGASPRPKGDPRYFGGKIPWIMISDVTRQPGKYLYSTKQGVTEAGAQLSRKLPAGSLILSNSGTVCVPKILKVDGCIHDGFVAFPTLERNVDLDFAFYWFEAVRPRIIDENRQGVTQVNLNTGIVREMPFPFAPRDEQKAIVAEIEKQFTRLDAGVASLKRVQTALKRYRASVLKAACEGRLVPTEAELARKENRSYETSEELLQRILKERREKQDGKNKYKELLSTNIVDLPQLPQRWVYAKVGQLGDVQLGRQRSPKNVSKDFPTKYIRAANITEHGIDISDVLEMEFNPGERERFALREDDVVLSEASGSASQVGKPAIWHNELPLCCFQNTVIRFRPSILDSRYALVIFRHFYVNKVFAKIAGGVGINHLGADKFSAIPFPLPPLREQQRIVAEVERRLSMIEELETVTSIELQRATGLRQSILEQAFKGKLTARSNILG